MKARKKKSLKRKFEDEKSRNSTVGLSKADFFLEKFRKVFNNKKLKKHFLIQKSLKSILLKKAKQSFSTKKAQKRNFSKAFK